MMVDLGSVIRGVRAMVWAWPYVKPVPKWSVHPGERKFWFHFWTPTWHRGRGPYLSIGLYFVEIYRGY